MERQPHRALAVADFLTLPFARSSQLETQIPLCHVFARRPNSVASLIHISWIVLQPELLVLLISLPLELLRPGDGRVRAASLLEHLHLLSRARARSINAVHVDPMRRAGDMQAPVPRSTHAKRLRVERIVPAAAHDFDPALDVARERNLPSTPGPLMLR